ncbi:MAG: hypothetical protein LUD76_05415, partial [Alistipes sp.]|nr:hypothetical protein [Alistipes sp.]
MKKFLFTVLTMYFLTGIEYHANGNEPMQIVIEEISPESFEALASAVASIGGPTEVELFTPYVYTGYSELGFY